MNSVNKYDKTEGEIQNEIIEVLKLNGCLVFRMNSGQAKHNVKLAPSGTPDLFVITRSGIHYWIEVKTEKGKLRESQAKMIEELKRRNQCVILARDITAVQEIK